MDFSVSPYKADGTLKTRQELNADRGVYAEQAKSKDAEPTVFVQSTDQKYKHQTPYYLQAADISVDALEYWKENEMRIHNRMNVQEWVEPSQFKQLDMASHNWLVVNGYKE